MDHNHEFSIYPGLAAKRMLHLIYWVLMFFFIVVILYYSLRLRAFNADLLLLSLCAWCNAFFVHYFTSFFLIRHVRHGKWWFFVPDILFVYGLSLVVLSGLFTLLAHLFPEKEQIHRMYELYASRAFKNPFNGNILMWLSSFIFWFNTPGIIVKIAKDYHESSMEKLAIAKEKNSMEINFLRAQIQPHFLFNTLNSVYGMVIENEAASNLVVQLSNLLRFSLYDSVKDHITLKEEIAFLSNYLLLERMRYKESRVRIEYDFDQIQNQEKLIKPLILINFIENAFKHGVNASIRQAWVKLSMTEKEGILIFHVANNKPMAVVGKRTVEQAGGLGLKNVRRRLELEYQTRYSLDIKESDEVYEVALVLKL